MVRKAIVAGFGESWIELLSLDEVERAHDEACGSGGSCGSSGCGCRVSGRPFRAALPRNLEVKTGDTVEVSASSGRAAAASLLVLGLPLAASAAGWFAARTAFPGAFESIGAAGAAAGLFAGIILVLIAGRRKSGERLPVVTAVVG